MDRSKVITLMYKYYVDYGTIKPKNAKPYDTDFKHHIQEKVLIDYLAERVEVSASDPLDELEYWENLYLRVLGDIEYQDGRPMESTLEVVNWAAHGEHFIYEMIQYIRMECAKQRN